MAQYTYQIWDKLSPINGVEAQAVIRDHEITEDAAVYLIMQGDAVQVFQYFNPEKEGFQPMTKEEAKAVAQRQMKMMEQGN